MKSSTDIRRSTMSSICLIIVVVMVTINADTKQCTTDSLCECTQNEACILKCIGDQACKGSTKLICKSGYPCTIICDSNGNTEACLDTRIDGNGATNITLECTDNFACTSARINCGDATHCDTTCTGDSACLMTDLDCDKSHCSIDCQAGSSNTCKDIYINTNNAISFNCYNDCLNPSIPNDFSNITPNPSIIPATAYPTISLSANPSITPSYNPTINASIPPNSLSSTNAPNEYHIINSTKLPSVSPSVSSTKTYILTTTVSEKSVQENNEKDMSDVVLGMPLWMIAVIGFGIVCCLLLVLMLCIMKRKKKSYVSFESSDVNENDKKIAVRRDRPRTHSINSIKAEFKKGIFATVFNDFWNLSPLPDIDNIICEQIASKQGVKMHDNMDIKLVTIPENNTDKIEVEGPPKIFRHMDEDVVREINQNINQTVGIMENDDMDVVETVNITQMLMEYMDEGETNKNGTHEMLSKNKNGTQLIIVNV